MEYAKTEKKNTIVENKKSKEEVEVLPDGMVKINGKLYKLNPVVSKKTSE